MEQALLPLWPPRFRCEPQLAGVVTGEMNLDSMFSFLESPTLGADYTVRWERVIYRVKREHIAADMRGARVQLERRLDGSRWLRWRRQVVALEACGRRPGPGQPPRQGRARPGKSAQEKEQAKQRLLDSRHRLSEAYAQLRNRPICAAMKDSPQAAEGLR